MASRREVLAGVGTATAAVLLAHEAVGQGSVAPRGESRDAEYGAASTGATLTRDLSRFLATFRFEDIPAEALHNARRSLLDLIGVAIAGSKVPEIGQMAQILRQITGRGEVAVYGPHGTFAPVAAAQLLGQMGHVLDFDNGHMVGTQIFASTCILGALLTLAQMRPLSGRDLAAAYVAGFEGGVRVGQAMPQHHAGGWHLTGTLGTICAAVASAKALGLDATGMESAIGAAATQAAGLQRNRGTPYKSFHAGRAACQGLTAALMAEAGMRPAAEALEGRLGFCGVYSREVLPERIAADLGTRWETLNNGHKPYACGIVLHPAIDAVIELARAGGPPAAQVESLSVEVHRDAVRITGMTDPRTGLETKFSLPHALAVAYVDRAAGIAQFTEERLGDPEVLALRERITATIRPDFRRFQAAASVVGAGIRKESTVRAATGTAENPMSDEAIVGKYMANVEPALGATKAERLRALAWRFDELADAAMLVRAAL